MPIFEYKCKSCGLKFEFYREERSGFMSFLRSRPIKLFSTFCAHVKGGSGAASSGSSCAGCSGGHCATCK